VAAVEVVVIDNIVRESVAGVVVVVVTVVVVSGVGVVMVEVVDGNVVKVRPAVKVVV